VIAIISMLRSLVHIVAADGGAGSIAGMGSFCRRVAAGKIFTFTLWGSSQLVYTVNQTVVAFRYRALIPRMYLLLILELLLRILVGRFKPVNFEHTLPWAWGNFILLPIAIGMLILCCVTSKKTLTSPLKYPMQSTLYCYGKLPNISTII